MSKADHGGIYLCQRFSSDIQHSMKATILYIGQWTMKHQTPSKNYLLTNSLAVNLFHQKRVNSVQKFNKILIITWSVIYDQLTQISRCNYGINSAPFGTQWPIKRCFVQWSLIPTLHKIMITISTRFNGMKALKKALEKELEKAHDYMERRLSTVT